MSTQQQRATVKTSITMPKQMLETIQRLSARSGSSMSDVVRRAIYTKRLTYDTKRKGGKVLLKQPDNSVREVVFRSPHGK
jgi:Arc/MetJ-type ribon-helix-helix transcriptional regulator